MVNSKKQEYYIFNISYTNKLPKIGFVVALILLALSLSQCSYFSVFSRSTETSLQPDTTALRAQLLYQTNLLVAANSSNDSARISKRKTEFTAALRDYLAATHAGKRRLVMLDSLGQVVIIPVTITPMSTANDSIYLQSNPMVMDYFQPPILGGNSLSITVLPNKRLAVLFADSLVILNPFTSFQKIDTTLTFSTDFYSPVRSRQSEGRVNSENGHLNVVTSQFKMPQQFTLPYQHYYFNADSTFTASPWSVSNWGVLAGRSLYRVPSFVSKDFRDMVNLPADSTFALLTQRGYIQLFRASDHHLLWTSDRPWGNRLAFLSDTLLAVFNDPQNSFILFKPDNDQLDLLGQSKNYSGRITGLTEITTNNIPRIVVAYTNSTSGTQQSTHFEFFRVNQTNWITPVEYPRPIYPNYDNSITLLEQDWKQNYPFSFSRVPKSLWSNLFETLYTKHRHHQPQPLLAKSASSDKNNKTWTIHLQSGIQFSDNSLLTTQEIINAWKSLWAKCYDNNSQDVWLLNDIRGSSQFQKDHSAHIVGLQAVNATTLKISLNRSHPHFLDELTHPIFSVYKTDPQTNLPTGTGVLQLTGIQIDSASVSITAQRNPYFHKGYPGIAHVEETLQTTDLADSLANMSQAGTLTRRRSDLDYFNKLKRSHLYRFPQPVIYFLAINPDQSPLNNQALREAVATALNRKVTASIVTEAHCMAVGSFISDGTISTTWHSDTTHFAIKQPLRIAYRAYDRVARQIAERLAARLSQKKIAHQMPEALSETNFEQLRKSGRYDILIDSYVPEFNFDGYNLMQLVARDYSLPDAIRSKVKASLESTSSTKAKSAETQLIKEGILYPIIGASNYVVLPPFIRDVEVRESSQLNLQNAWIPYR